MNDKRFRRTAERSKCGNQTALIICCLAVITLAACGRAVTFDFVNIDDGPYVYNNPRVLAGLTAPGLRWAFTTFHQANWHPLTWISLMADAQATRWSGSSGLTLGDPNAGVFHLTNVILHTANVLLLFVLLSSMTGMRWRSAFVAALFAVHPLHAESFAWVTERKDVLSTLFWLLTMLAYLRYVRRPTRAGYLLMASAYALGLMAKPMLVTLPLVLLLIDFWPLRRMRLRLLVLEKLPLFALALCSCVVTFWAQRAGGAVATVQGVPFAARLFNTDVSYGAYALKMVWPVGLAAAYPFRLAIPAWEITLAAAFFVTATALAVRAARHESLRWMTVGWFWYVIALLPVIGLVQVGEQAMADRYTYVPLIGLFIIVAWGVPMLAERFLRRQVVRSAVLAVVAGLAIPALGAQCYVQTGYWQDSVTLARHALSVTGDNPLAELNLASALADQGDTDDAIPRLRSILERHPQFAEAQLELGTVLLKMSQFREAEIHLRRAVESWPKDIRTRNNLGVALLYQGKAPEAIEQFEAALRIDPGDRDALTNLDQARGLADGQ